MVDIHSSNEEKSTSIVTDINLLNLSEENCNQLNEHPAETHHQSPDLITFAERKARRRSSFFVPIRADTAKEDSSCTETEKSDEGETSKPFVRRRSLRRSTIALRKRPMRKLSNRTKFEFSFSPAPGHVRPILSATQRAARRLSVKAVHHLRNRHVRINMEPQVIDITPRSDKIPGVIKMPSSPVPSDGDHRPVGIVECYSSLSLGGVNDRNPTHHDKGDGSGKYNEVTNSLEAVTDVAMNTSDACSLDAKKARQRQKKAKNNNNKVSGFAMRLRNHRLSVLPPPILSQVMDDSDEKDVGIVSQDSHSPDPCVERKTASNTTNNGKEESVTDAKQDPGGRSWTEECLLSLPTASSEHKVKVWMAIDTDQNGLREVNVAEPITDEDNNFGFDEVTYPEANILKGNHNQRRSALIHRSSQSIKDEEEEVAEITEDLTDESNLSMRKRRRSFILASERISSHDYTKSRKSRIPSADPADTLISTHAHPSQLPSAFVDSSENIPLAPIFVKHVETTKHTKKTLRNTPKARNEALKTLKEPKSRKDDTKKSLKKRRQADRIAYIALNDEVMPVDEQSTSEPQTSGMELEMSIFTDVTHSNVGVSKWPLHKRLDYAPFSSIGHVGAVLMAKQHYNTQPVKKHRHRMRECSSLEVDSESSKFTICDGFRKSMKHCHSSHPETAASASERCNVEEDANSRTHSHGEHNLRRIERLLPRLRHDQWCEVLKPHRVSEFIGNDLAVELVRSWIAKWKKHLERCAGKSPLSSPNTMKNSRKKKSTTLDGDDSDDDYDDDYGEVAESVLVLSGPCGCGKTALVYALAEEMNMRVVELACNERRNASIMRSRIAGATQNYQVACSPLMRSFNVNGPTPQHSVVLIDDVDVTFTDEENFWSTLKSICCETRAPIILTCSDVDVVKRELSVEMYEVKMNRPTAYQISNYLYVILTAIGMNGVSRMFLYRLAEYLNCDLRACINHLQLYSDSYQTLCNSIPKERKHEDGEEYLKRCRYLSSLSCCAPRFSSSNGHFRTHYSDVTTSADDEESNCLLAEEFPSIFERDDMPQHESILKTRSSLFCSRYCSTSDIACDYVPGLVLIDRGWRRGVAHRSRRRLHYFDSLTSNIGGKELTTAIRSYKFTVD